MEPRAAAAVQLDGHGSSTPAALSGTPQVSALQTAPTAEAAARILQAEALALGGGAIASGERQELVRDLDGDELSDVIAITQPPRHTAQATVDGASNVTFTARGGRTEDVLWSFSLAGQMGAVLPVTVGDGGLVVATTAINGSAGAGSLEMTYAGISQDGKIRWRQPFIGLVNVVGHKVILDAPLFRGAVGSGSANQQHVLVALIDSVSGSDGTSPSTAAADAVLLDSRTGAQISSARFEDAGLVLPWPGPDANGDGRGDVVFSSAYGVRNQGREGHLALADGATGELRWITYSVPSHYGSWVTAVGDTDGDGSGDVAIGPGFANVPDGSGVALLSGKDGTLRWQRPGDFPLALGDVDGDGLADTGVRSFELRPHRRIPEYGQVNAAYRGDASAIYRTEITHQFKRVVKSYGATVTVQLLGTDLDGDGILDARSTELLDQDGALTDVSGAFSGANGRRLFTGPPGADAGGSLTADMAGHDLVLVMSRPGNRAQVTARDGATGDELWTRLLPLDGQIVQDPDSGPIYDVTSADIDGDGVPEAALNLEIRDPSNPLTASKAVTILIRGPAEPSE